LRLIFVIKEVGSVNQLSRLLFQHSLDRRMRVTESIDPNSAEKIEVALPFRVPEINSSAAGEEHLLPVVRWQQEFLFRTNYGSQAHTPTTSVPYSSF